MLKPEAEEEKELARSRKKIPTTPGMARIRLRRVTTVSGSHEPIAGSRHRNRMVFSNTALDRLVKALAQYAR
jgi:hypothetical protein